MQPHTNFLFMHQLYQTPAVTFVWIDALARLTGQQRQQRCTARPPSSRCGREAELGPRSTMRETAEVPLGDRICGAAKSDDGRAVRAACRVSMANVARAANPLNHRDY